MWSIKSANYILYNWKSQCALHRWHSKDTWTDYHRDKYIYSGSYAQSAELRMITFRVSNSFLLLSSSFFLLPFHFPLFFPSLFLLLSLIYKLFSSFSCFIFLFFSISNSYFFCQKKKRKLVCHQSRIQCWGLDYM